MPTHSVGSPPCSLQHRQPNRDRNKPLQFRFAPAGKRLYNIVRDEEQVGPKVARFLMCLVAYRRTVPFLSWQVLRIAVNPTLNSETRAQAKTAPRWRTTLIVGALLLLGFALRMLYAYGLPLSYDETVYLGVASRRARTGAARYPMTSRSIKHPMLTIHLTTACVWVAGESAIFVRFVYVLVRLGGLLGLYWLTRVLFGEKAALLALLLGALDRYLISTAPSFRPEALSLAFVPWSILVCYVCVQRGRTWIWFLLAALLALGYLSYEQTVFLILALGVYVVCSGRLRRCLSDWRLYAGACLAVSMVAPVVMRQAEAGTSNVIYVTRALESPGLTPRVLLLYVGDLMLAFRDTAWLIAAASRQVYAALHLPCAWPAGVLYLCCFGYSLTRFRQRPHFLAAVVILGIALPVSVLLPRESWNNFWWADATLPPILAVTGFAGARLMSRPWGKAFVAAAAVGLFAATAAFLAGPKYTYAFLTFSSAKAHVGKMMYLSRKDGLPRGDASRALEEIDRFLREHPGSAVPYYYRAWLAKTDAERSAALEAARRADPESPLVALMTGKQHLSRGEWEQARQAYKSVLEAGYSSWSLHYHLAQANARLGRMKEAETHARRTIAIFPDHAAANLMLFSICLRSGREKEARAVLDEWGANTGLPHEPYVKAAGVLVKAGGPEKARQYYAIAQEYAPNLPSFEAWLRQEREAQAPPPVGTGNSQPE